MCVFLSVGVSFVFEELREIHLISTRGWRIVCLCEFREIDPFRFQRFECKKSNALSVKKNSMFFESKKNTQHSQSRGVFSPLLKKREQLCCRLTVFVAQSLGTLTTAKKR